MQYANSRKFKEISKETMTLDIIGENKEYEFARAIYTAEIKKITEKMI